MDIAVLTATSAVYSYIWLQTATDSHTGRNEVRWHPGQEESLSPPCSNLSPFGSKFTALKEVLATILKLVGPPALIPTFTVGPPALIRSSHIGSAPRDLCPQHAAAHCRMLLRANILLHAGALYAATI